MMRKSVLFFGLMLCVGLLATAVSAQQYPPDQPLGEVKILRRVTEAGAVTATIEIPVTADTYVASNRPDENFGSSGNMWLGFDQAGGRGAVRPMMYFDTGVIPRGAVINSATLRFYLGGSDPSGDGAMGYEARYLNSDWNENEVTWNQHQPEWGGVIGQGAASSDPGWHEANVRDMVREWVSNGRPNHGLIIIGDENPAQNRTRNYFTKESGSGLYAQLIVDFSSTVDDVPPIAHVKSLPSWSPANFRAEWEGYDPNNSDGSTGSGVAYYDVWYKYDNDGWSTFKAQTTSTGGDFKNGQHLRELKFTARAVDNAGNVQNQEGTQTSTRIDAYAPEASVNPLPAYTTSSTIVITWGGSDSGSGIATYDVQWREAGGSWSTLLEDTTRTSYQANGAQDGKTYEFRARAVDFVGNTQPFPDWAQAQTTIALKPVSTITGFVPPFLQRLNGPQPSDLFEVFWTGTTAPGTTITGYDVYVRTPVDGNWRIWLADTPLTNSSYVLSETDPDGFYEFEVVARNSLGQSEERTYQPDGRILVDRFEPFVLPQSYSPVLLFPRRTLIR
jgi:hypothetical protein